MVGGRRGSYSGKLGCLWFHTSDEASSASKVIPEPRQEASCLLRNVAALSPRRAQPAGPLPSLLHTLTRFQAEDPRHIAASAPPHPRQAASHTHRKRGSQSGPQKFFPPLGYPVCLSRIGLGLLSAERQRVRWSPRIGRSLCVPRRPQTLDRVALVGHKLGSSFPPCCGGNTNWPCGCDSIWGPGRIEAARGVCRSRYHPRSSGDSFCLRGVYSRRKRIWRPVRARDETRVFGPRSSKKNMKVASFFGWESSTSVRSWSASSSSQLQASKPPYGICLGS